MAFVYEENRRSILEFAERVPELLLRHPSTAHLALQISQLDLPSIVQSQFTVAIIGQMRAGKSTLLNALVRQRIAPVGVTETTATINWFRYAEGDRCEKFRVNWLDGTSEDWPLNEAGEWLSRSENAQSTASIEFFCFSDFLKKRASIVDTPGTRTTNADERRKTDEFLAEKLERETLKHGGRAHAVIYAINPIAMQANVDELRQYIEQTRVPGASAYNSIAVVQKWEQLRPDPISEVARLCGRLRQQLEGLVAEVVPASGLLALSLLERDAEDWDMLVELASRSTPEAAATLSRSDRHFRSDVPGAALDGTLRNELLGRLGWPTLLFAMWITGARQLRSGRELHDALYEVSGIDRVRAILLERFFGLSELIQGGATLRKAWDPCKIGMLTFRDQIDRRREMQRLGQQALQLLERNGKGALDPVGEYVRRSLEGADKEIVHLSEAYRQLDELFHREERNFHLLDLDVWCLHEVSAYDFEPDERYELLALFGQHGPEVRARLRLAEEATRDATLDRAGERHSFWKTREMRAQGGQRKIFGHAVERLETILDHLEGEA